MLITNQNTKLYVGKQIICLESIPLGGKVMLSFVPVKSFDPSGVLFFANSYF